MNKTKTLGTVLDAAEMLDVDLRKDENGKIVNRSTAYDVVRRLPDRLKIRLGTRSIRVNLPKLQAWIDGEDRAA